MEKNSFLIYNDIICSLYTCQKKEDLKTRFLVPLGMLIPYSYSSLLFSASSHEKKRNPQNPSELYESPPLCVPEDFTGGHVYGYAETHITRFVLSHFKG